MNTEEQVAGYWKDLNDKLSVTHQYQALEEAFNERLKRDGLKIVYDGSFPLEIKVALEVNEGQNASDPLMVKILAVQQAAKSIGFPDPQANNTWVSALHVATTNLQQKK